MIYTPQQAAEYIAQSIKETSGDEISPDIIEGVIEDQMYEAISTQLTEADLQTIEHHEDPDFFWEYCQEKIPNYQKLLDQYIQDFLVDYSTTDEEETIPSPTQQ